MRLINIQLASWEVTHFHVSGFSALGHAILLTCSAGQYDHVYCEADRCFVDLVRLQKVQRLLGNLNP